VNSSAGRPFGMNAGSFADASIETLVVDVANAAEGIAPANVRVAERQAASAQFLQQHGAEVIYGHMQVGVGSPVVERCRQRRSRGAVTRPVVQLAAAVVVMLSGAWLIGLWAFGLVLFMLGLVVAADALLRDDGSRTVSNSPSSEVLERWRRQR